MIDTPNRRKQKRVCHVNLLKLYIRRDEKLFPNSANAVTVNVATVVQENDFGVSIPAMSDLKISIPTHTKSKDLTLLQQTEFDELLASYADIFSDTFGKTSLATHHIALVSDAKPVSLSPYRLHPEKAKLVQNEIDEMLKMGIITHSDSPWASPIVIASYYRKYIPHFAWLSDVLSDLLRKNTKFEWSEKTEQAFVDIKSRLASRPILVSPDYSKPFIVTVDASDFAIGASLIQ